MDWMTLLLRWVKGGGRRVRGEGEYEDIAGGLKVNFVR